MKIKATCQIVTGILILIGRLRCLKEEIMDIILVKCIFQNRFPSFQ